MVDRQAMLESLFVFVFAELQITEGALHAEICD
jgi:hypothetical protein